MDWEQKFAAINALDYDASLCMRKPGDWYVACRLEIKKGSVLEGGAGPGRATPEEAVEHYFARITSLLKVGEYVVCRAHGGSSRRAVKWNGFMWADVREAA